MFKTYLNWYLQKRQPHKYVSETEQIFQHYCDFANILVLMDPQTKMSMGSGNSRGHRTAPLLPIELVPNIHTWKFWVISVCSPSRSQIKDILSNKSTSFKFSKHIDGVGFFWLEYVPITGFAITTCKNAVHCRISKVITISYLIYNNESTGQNI